MLVKSEMQKPHNASCQTNRISYSVLKSGCVVNIYLSIYLSTDHTYFIFIKSQCILIYIK